MLAAHAITRLVCITIYIKLRDEKMKAMAQSVLTRDKYLFLIKYFIIQMKIIYYHKFLLLWIINLEKSKNILF